MNLGVLLLSVVSFSLVVIQFMPISSGISMVNTGISDIGIGLIMTSSHNTESLREGIVLEMLICLVRVQNFIKLRRQEVLWRYLLNSIMNRSNNKVRQAWRRDSRGHG